MSPAWGADPNDTYRVVIGGIDFQFDVPWMHGEAPFYKKRYEYLFVQLSSPDSGVTVNVDFFRNGDLLNVAKLNEYELLGAVVYDSAVYDRDRYASAVQAEARFRISRTGKTWRVRIRSIDPDEELTVLKVAMQSALMSHKS